MLIMLIVLIVIGLSVTVAPPPCVNALDLGVIADISTSIGKPNLPKLKEALATVVDKFEISPEGTHMGFITFARNANLLFNFADGKYHDKEAAKQKISEIQGLHHATRTDKALILANDELFTEAGGDRPDKPNVLLVFTDGKPTPKHGYQDFSVTVPPLEVSLVCSLHCLPRFLRLYLRHI